MKAINKIERLPLKELDSGALVLLLQKYILDAPEHFNAEKVFNALNLATYLHRKATRSFRMNLPGTPYIEHPLRNAIRLLRAGCNKETVIIATLLHDTIEDCSDEIVSVFLHTDETQFSEAELRVYALVYLKQEFGEEVSLLVSKVSNAILPAGCSVEEKNSRYVQGVKNSIYDADTYATKFTDIQDNALGLYHNYVKGKDNSKTIKRAVKYFAVIEVFEHAFPHVMSELPMNDASKNRVLHILGVTRERLSMLISLGV